MQAWIDVTLDSIQLYASQFPESLSVFWNTIVGTVQSVGKFFTEFGRG